MQTYRELLTRRPTSRHPRATDCWSGVWPHKYACSITLHTLTYDIYCKVYTQALMHRNTGYAQRHAVQYALLCKVSDLAPPRAAGPRFEHAPRTLSPGCRHCRHCRQLSAAVGSCRQAVGRLSAGCRQACCRRLSAAVGSCRQLSAAVGSCRRLSAAVGGCRLLSAGALLFVDWELYHLSITSSNICLLSVADTTYEVAHSIVHP